MSSTAGSASYPASAARSAAVSQPCSHVSLCAGQLYRQLQAGSSGLALGALMLPWVFGGLAAKQQQLAGATLAPPAAHALHASVAASAAALLVLHWQWQLQRRRGGAARIAQNGTAMMQPRQNSSAAAAAQAASTLWPGWVPAAALLILLAAAAAEYAGSGLQHAAALLAIAGVAGCGMHALLTLLPCVFTVGEALVAAEAAALLGHSALQELGPASQSDAPAPFQRFVVLLAAGSLVATAMLIPLLLRCQPGTQARAAAKTRGQSATSSNLPTSATTARAAAAAVAVAAAAAIAPAALWAVRYALSSRRRLLLLCWWAVDLAAALPAMHLLNRSGRVPPILGERREAVL